MDVFHLKCFVALAEHLSFSNAAHALYMEPSTLSKTISKLEQEMKVRLFERTNRKVRLTAAGAMFLADVKDLITIYENCMTKANAAAQGQLGNICICYCGDIEYSILPHATRRFLRTYPNVHVQLFRYSWRQIYNFEIFRQMDLGISLSFGLPDFPKYECCTICDDPYVAVLPFDHPLATRKSLSIRELEHDTFIFPSREMSQNIFLHALDCIFPSGFHPKITNRDDCAEAANLKIAAGLGVGISTMLARRNEPMLRYVPLSDVPPAHLNALWLPDNINPLVERYISIIKEEHSQHTNRGESPS